jgi:hypothetical protein
MQKQPVAPSPPPPEKRPRGRPPGSRNKTQPERVAGRITAIIAGLPQAEAQRVLFLCAKALKGARPHSFR